MYKLHIHYLLYLCIVSVRIPYRIIALLLAFLMFFTSTGFSMDVHYCQGKVKTISLFGKAKACSANEAATCYHRTSSSVDKQNLQTSVKKKKCCHNQNMATGSFEFEGTSSDLITLQDVQFEFIVAFVAAFVEHHSVLTNDYVSFNIHQIPIPDQDLHVLYQSFLI